MCTLQGNTWLQHKSSSNGTNCFMKSPICIQRGHPAFLSWGHWKRVAAVTDGWLDIVTYHISYRVFADWAVRFEKFYLLKVKIEKDYLLWRQRCSGSKWPRTACPARRFLSMNVRIRFDARCFNFAIWRADLVLFLSRIRATLTSFDKFSLNKTPGFGLRGRLCSVSICQRVFPIWLMSAPPL